MFKLAKYLKKELEKYKNMKVILSRQRPEDYFDVESRGEIAAENACDMMISLHSSEYKNEKACGVTVLRSIKRENSAQLANLLASAVVDVMDKKTGITYFRGGAAATKTLPVTGDDYCGVIRSSVKSAKIKYSYIIEHGFHTNKKECLFLSKNRNLKHLAQAEAKTIGGYFILNIE